MQSFLISLLTSLGGASIATIALIKLLGNKILEAQFQKSLENYKYTINSRFDRISKIHEKEFEILPLLWSSIIETNTNLHRLTSQFQEYPNVNNMNQTQLLELYEVYSFRKSEIEKIDNSSDKLSDFIQIDYWKKIQQFNISMNKFDTIFHNNKIFLLDELENEILKIRNILNESISIIITSIDHVGRIDYKYKLTATKKHEEIDSHINKTGDLIKR
jgi:hypothetical protein